MQKSWKIIRLFFLFLCFYYSVYALCFSVTFQGFPLIYYIQKELTVDPDQNTATFLYFDKHKQYDILFLGSSHTYRGFDTHLFERHGYNTYNLGTVAQAPLNSWFLLKDLRLPPKRLILEVYPPAVNASGKEAFFYLNKNFPNYSSLFKMAMSLKDLRCFNLLSIKPFIDWHIKRSPLPPVKNYKGYVSTKDSVPDTQHYSVHSLDTSYFSLQLSYLKKIAAYCKEKKIGLLLVYAPVPKKLIIKGESLFIQQMVHFAETNNIIFADFGRKHSLQSKNHFCDDNHLNQAGVLLFNQQLISEYFLN